MKRIVINGRFLCRNPTGVDRFATELLRKIDEWCLHRASEVDALELEVVIPRSSTPRWKPKSIPVREFGNFRGHMWEQFSLPWQSRDGLLLSLCNTGPIFARKHVVAIHDATPIRVPSSFSWSFRTLYRLLMPMLGRMTDRVITVSEFSKKEIRTCYGIDEGKIRVVPNSGEQMLRAVSDDRIFDRVNLNGRPYVLAVATNAKHKNMAVLGDLAKSLQGQGINVVVAGGKNGRVFQGEESISDDGVLRTGFVTDGELRALYGHALCFVFPSLYEGFGIPPLEAMLAGCPVISSNSSALPEVLGEAALYFSPMDAERLYQAVQDVRYDEKLRLRLIERGHQQAAKYEWRSSALTLLNICREVLSGERLS